MPRSFLSARPIKVAWLVVPGLICRVEPSSISRAISRPMALAASDSGGLGDRQHRFLFLDHEVDIVDMDEAAAQHPGHFRVDLHDDHVRRMAAARVMSTDTPRLIQPKSSGGVAWIRATWIGRRRLLNNRGMAERFSGVRNRDFLGQLAGFCRSHVERADVQALASGFDRRSGTAGGFQ
jgi:hypothetical protein